MTTDTISALDPTTTDAWIKLARLAKTHPIDLRQAFNDPKRAGEYAFHAGDLFVDLSKNLIDKEIIEALVSLADQCHLEAYRDRMFAGEHINVTEDRAVLHTALRRCEDEKLMVDGQDCVSDVRQELKKIYAFARDVRSGAWKGVTGKTITDVVSIGIGGSDLGPVMVYEALKAYRNGPRCHFISNIDPQDAGEKLKELDPETTLVIIVSKTFTTLETLTNARAVKKWLVDELKNRAIIKIQDDIDKATRCHFVAVSTALEKVERFGIDKRHVFGFWNWVGGRYSVDSAVGTALVLAFGPERFEEFLRGFHAMDEHFASAPLTRNVPVLMGLINIWYRNFLGASTHSVLPYNQYLHRLPAYLQQLTMESNGKKVRYDGSVVSYDTGEVFWGEPGTNGQHAFYQLIHQGTQLVPADFIAFAQTQWDFHDDGVRQHELFLGNFFAQTKALAFGKTAQEVREEGTTEQLVPARTFSGNRPTTSIMAPQLNPRTLGQLIALYEHITFVEGAIWAIDSFDQWGVELGKALAKELAPAVAGDLSVLNKQDGSTQQLVEYYRQHRN